MSRLRVVLLIAVGLVIVPPAFAADESDGWKKLFNGKDLTGWTATTAAGNGKQEITCSWKVVDGMIVGSGPVSHLFSIRGDYENFQFRITARVNNKGNSGQYFRAQFGPGFPQGYEAQINSTHGDPIKTGSLYPAFNSKLPPVERAKLIIKEAPHGPDEFFTQEVTAIGNRITITVNGKTTVDFTDANNTFTKGHFAIQQHDPGSVITIKAIEVKELPATTPR